MGLYDNNYKNYKKDGEYMDEDISDSPLLMGAMKFCIFAIIGVMILNSIYSGTPVSSTESVSLTFTGNPSDGDNIQLDNHIYEFDSGDGVATGHTSVDIEQNMVGTTWNFVNVSSVDYEVAQ
jgi:hypothetical protein